MNKPKKLYFAKGNAKLHKDTLVFSLPAGHSCPGALLCLSKSNRDTGKITDGAACQFRCYATTSECLFPHIRKSRWDNFELLRKAGNPIAMAQLISSAIDKFRKVKLVRLHQSGDFFSQAYFDAWMLVAKDHPKIIFYGYTKALPFWVQRRSEIPANMRLVASMGGKFDHLIATENLRYVKVVGLNPAESPEKEATRLGLELDHDDTHAWKSNTNFAIALHGTQPAGSLAGKAWYIIKTQGRGGYKSDYFRHYAQK